MPDPVTSAPRRASRFSRVRARVRAVPGGWVLWRIGITVIGVAIIAVGIVLLPLPGPGWVIIFAGLGVLATEYAWAAALLAWVRRLFSSWTAWLGRRGKFTRIVLGLLGIALLVAIGLGVWWFVYR